MATPLTASAFIKALRDEGCRVVEVGDWRNHNRNSVGKWGGVNGVMIHHTVTKGTAATVDICRKGYSGLPGPLCHGVIAKDGTIHLVGYGRANHAGLGDSNVLNAVIDERALPGAKQANVDGNARFYGFECENLGDGKDPWPEAQVEAIVRASAALLRAHGWGKDGDTSVIGHKEWQPGKVDPLGPGISMTDIRKRVAARLKGQPSTDPGKDEPSKGGSTVSTDLTKTDVFSAVWSTDAIPAWPQGHDFETNPTWAASTYLRGIYNFVRRIDTQVAAQGAAINELAKSVAELATNQADVDADALIARIKAEIEKVTVRLEVDNA